MELKDLSEIKDKLDGMSCKSYTLKVELSDNMIIEVNKPKDENKKIGY